MTKSFFVFLVLVLFIGGAAWLFLKKSKTVAEFDADTSPSSSNTTSATSTPSVTRFPDGLQIEDVKVGAGKEAKAGDAISVHYVGMLESGQKFDSSYDRGQPAVFTVGVGSLIKGWDEGIPGMKVGGKRKLVVPSGVGYGAAGVPARDQQGRVIPNQYVIPPNATLLFEVELLDVLPAPQS
jgi:FKBP-type peptidyl-prolyl cis-trans isomerase